MTVIKIGEQNMMKKTIAYVVSAVLLGVALMWIPLHLVLTPSASLQPYAMVPSSASASPEAFAGNELMRGVTPHYPADEISLVLMSAFSLILATVVFRQSKKRTV
jgi:hypothetical protein